MQDRYTGDVGDYGKYGLLKALSAVGDKQHLKIGIVWYLVPSETHNNDGKHINYLRNKATASARRLRKCDPFLYDGLRSLLINDENDVVSLRRMVSAIEGSGVLPSDTLYYNVPLSYSRLMPASERLKLRRTWLLGALQATASADLVFLDPDMGIQCNSVSSTDLMGPKYVYWDDISSFVSRGQIVVVYHHFGRLCSTAKQVELIQAQFQKRMPRDVKTSAVIYRRGTRRAYFIVTPQKHMVDFAKKLSQLLIQWKGHFIN